MSKVMRLSCLVLLFVTGLNAELRNVNPDPNGEPWLVGGVVWDEKEMLWYNSLPVFVPSPDSNPATLPDRVDNSESPYFRSIFNQQNGSCAQASTIGYTFTYEINRKLRRSVLDIYDQDIEANEFPTHFTYNYWNKGSGANGSYISDAVSTSHEFGVPDCSVWREVTREASDRYSIPPRWEDPMGGNFIQWMTGYERYGNAMKNRTITAQSLAVGWDESNLTKLKQFLFDHGADDTAIGGGLAVFTMNFTNIVYGIYPVGSPEENKPFIKDTHGDIDHAMTIVGYNDLVEFDYDGINGCTNHLDTNGDGQVNLADWEKGALIIANSHGETWPRVGDNRDKGFCYLPYRLLAELWENKYKVQEITRIVVEPEVEPVMAYKVTVDHSNRKLLRCEYFGVSDDINAINPNVGSRIISFQGGEDKHPEITWDLLPMQGYNQEPLEFGIDLSENVGYLAGADPIKYFLTFKEVDDEEDENNLYNGIINSFTIVDYRNSNELHIKYPIENVRIGQLKELTMLYDVLPVAIETDMLVPQTFNIGIPQSSMISGVSTFIPDRGVRFFMHNTDLSITDGSVMNLGNRTIFNGFDSISQDRIMNYSEIDMQNYGILALNNLDLCLFNGSSTKIQRIELSGESSIQIEDGSFIEFKDNSYISAEGNTSISGDIISSNLSKLELKDNSILYLQASQFTVLPGTSVKLGVNSKLIVENGSSLVFEDGATVEMSEGAEIIIKDQGSLVVKNLNTDNVSFVNASDSWKGITCEVGSSISIYDAEFVGAITAISGSPSYCNIGNSIFTNCETGTYIESVSLSEVNNVRVRISENQFNNCVTGLVIYDSYNTFVNEDKLMMTAFNNQFNDCGTGIALLYSLSYAVYGNEFTDCVIGIDVTTSRCPIYDNVITGGTYGMQLTQAYGFFERNIIQGCSKGYAIISSSPNILKNTIVNNSNCGMKLRGYNSIPKLVNLEDNTLPAVNNNIIGNGFGYETNTGCAQIVLTDESNIYLGGLYNGLPYGGYNNIYYQMYPSPSLPVTPLAVPCILAGTGGTGSTSGSTKSPLLIQAESNYWGATKVTGGFFSYSSEYSLDYLPYSTALYPNDGSFVVGPAIGIGQIQSRKAVKFLTDAVSEEKAGNFSEAKNLYETIITDYPATVESYAALSSLPDVYGYLGLDSNILLSFYDSKINDSNRWKNKRFIEEMKVSTYLKNEKYDESIVLSESMKANTTVESEIEVIEADIAIARLMKQLRNNSKEKVDKKSLIMNYLKIPQHGTSSVTTGIVEEEILPNENTLYQNYPNPFNPLTQIRFALAKTANIKLNVYNIAGQRVAELSNGIMNAGTHSIEFDGSKFNSGVYYYTLEVEGKSLTQKMILIK